MSTRSQATGTNAQDRMDGAADPSAMADGAAAGAAGMSAPPGPGGAPAPGAARTAARLLRGAPLAAAIRAEVAREAEALCAALGSPPALAVVRVGDGPATAVYLQRILENCRQVGIEGRLVALDADVHPDRVADAVGRLSADERVAGILVGQPLPPTIALDAVLRRLDPAKDIDGIHPLSAGMLALGRDGFVPATAEAAVEILVRSGIELAGRRAVVVGRSNVVGKPAALLLLRRHATVTICHSRTADLAAETRRAEILIVAAGRPGLVGADMVAPGAVVVDVGINVIDGRIVGDVDERAAEVASAITPVPGGVGPLTNAILLTHLVRAACAQAGSRGLPLPSRAALEVPA